MLHYFHLICGGG